MNSLVAIKEIDLDQSRADIDSNRREASTMSLLSHTNILRAHCSFTVDRRLWVVMPFMSAGSLQSIISTSFPDGLPESCIAVVLKETLNALQYLHDQGHLHRDIKAGNILLDSDGSIKIADFGVLASIYKSNLNYWSSSSSSLSPSMRLSQVTGMPYWTVPEMIRLNFLAYESFSTETDVILFVEGSSKVHHDLYESYYNNNKSNFKLYVHECTVYVSKGPSLQQLADILTKGLDSTQFKYLCSNLMLGSLPQVEGM